MTADLQVEFRPATADDYADVLSIDPDVYDGFDYLPAMFHSLSRDPRNKMIVGLVDGKIEAFGMLTVVSEGAVTLGRGVRVSRRYRGTQLAFRLYLHAAALVTSPVYARMTPHTWPPKNLLRSKGIRQKLIMSRPKWMFAIKDISRIDVALHEERTTLPTMFLPTDETRAIFNDLEARERLFPHCWIYCDWVPVPMETSNVDYILETHAQVSVATFGGSKAQICEAFSLANYYMVPRGFLYAIDFYGNQVSSLAIHLALHMEKCRQVPTEGQLWFKVQVPDYVDIHQAEVLLKRVTSGVTSEMESLKRDFIGTTDTSERSKL